MKKKIAVLVMAVLMMIACVACGKEEYRTIKVYKIQGSSEVTRNESDKVDAYEGMLMESGDNVRVKDGKITVCADEDKYIYAEKGTEFNLVASGNAQNSKTTIEVKRGNVTSEIQNKLAADAVYEVNTPNLSMSVRGTVFVAGVDKKADGTIQSHLEVLNGNVELSTRDKSGNVLETYSVEAGKGISVNTDASGDVVTEGVRDVDLSLLSAENIEYLMDLSEEHGSEAILEVGEEGLEEYYEEYEEEINELREESDFFDYVDEEFEDDYDEYDEDYDDEEDEEDYDDDFDDEDDDDFDDEDDDDEEDDDDFDDEDDDDYDDEDDSLDDEDDDDDDYDAGNQIDDSDDDDSDSVGDDDSSDDSDSDDSSDDYGDDDE